MLEEGKYVWGLGVEHETNFFSSFRNVPSEWVAENLCKNLKASTYISIPRKYELVQKWLEAFGVGPEVTFKVYERFNPVPAYMSLKYVVLKKLLGKRAWERFMKENATMHKFDGETRVSDSVLQAIARPLFQFLKSYNKERITNTLKNLFRGVNLDVSDLAFYLEFITRDYADATIGQCVAELTERERIFVGYANFIQKIKIFAPRVGAWPFVIYHNDAFGTPLKNKKHWRDFSVCTDVLGSFHINITLPHPAGESKEKFLLRHRAAMLVLQWFEPFFVCVFGQPDPFGDMGMVDPSSAAFSIRPLFASGSYRMVEMPDSSMATQDVSSERSDVERQMSSGNILERRPEGPPPQYKTELLQELPGYNLPAATGADFRRDPEKHAFGFEFRILDTFPLKYLTDVLRILFLICDCSYTLWRENRLPRDPRPNAAFQLFAKQSIIQGFLAPVPFELYPVFSQIVGIPISQSKAKDVFQVIVHQLYKKYGVIGRHGFARGMYSRFVAKDSTENFFRRAPQVPPINNMTRKKLEDIFQWNNITQMLEIPSPRFDEVRDYFNSQMRNLKES